MKGYTFSRQRPVPNFIADFACLELKLVIEIDGLTHQWEETASKDATKENALQQAGFTVIRFTDEDVLTRLHQVVMSIEKCIEELESMKEIS